jgi:hypothetical protein
MKLKKTFLIEILLDKNITKSDLDLRNLLVDTIESRDLGEVVEETSSSDMPEVIVEVFGNERIQNDLQNLLISLGFNHYNIQDISNEDV